MEYFYEGNGKFLQTDVNNYAKLTGDSNPIHLDENFSKNTIFGKNIVHGVLLLSVFSKHFGTLFPGNGSIYISQTAKFLLPIYVNEDFYFRITLENYNLEKKRGYFKTEIYNSLKKVAIVGEAILKYENK